MRTRRAFPSNGGAVTSQRPVRNAAARGRAGCAPASTRGPEQAQPSALVCASLAALLRLVPPRVAESRPPCDLDSEARPEARGCPPGSPPCPARAVPTVRGLGWTMLESIRVTGDAGRLCSTKPFLNACPGSSYPLVSHSPLCTSRLSPSLRTQTCRRGEGCVWMGARRLKSINIMELTLQKYGSYEKFEQATGGSLLSKTRIWSHVRRYMVKEGCMGEIVVHLTEDLLSRASMTVVNGCPTLTINVSTAREHWLEGMLRHEIGTHYFRGINNLQQPWNSWTGRKKHELKPNNPTEEGLASLHSVLFRKDPFLWRAALLYYTVYRASQMSFCELFRDIGKFVKDPGTRWDYCVRAKRGWTDTSQPGCFSKDQVYLDGILQILRYRDTIDFHLLTALGKVSYEDVDRLKGLAVTENTRVPHFLQDRDRYMEHLEKIMEVNELADRELKGLIC
ncbi:uncharacterized protein KIAA0895 homolog isoform X5 [Pteropus vampyrus]|uniref:Uncharacterized protein KIAA0895 homolog isoform X5 n=1 Tax=Pteropus vampyrus TaxID=132908 RepID=A0A6P6CLC1_PTEVA|nr:uncharacterized protein KIAA0895 homolog isoform X5 [Pteropus vampyrus]